jgi:cellulose synthase/poly-beta-1,6-N-acetylglucosamine synthase-like glycosyltransferase
MSALLCVLAWALPVIFALPVIVFCFECLIGLWPRKGVTISAADARRFAVVVPAHDEESGIAETIAALSSELRPLDRLLVVADNCSDATAALARAAGAEVIERHDPMRRGKGYALSYAFAHLATDAPEVVVIVDADCRVSPGSLTRIATLAARTGRPVQADYLLQSPESAGPRSRVSAFAVLVRNRVRPRGLARLGLACQLTGSGMALRWDAVCAARPTEGNLVEDLALGLDLARQGRAPLYAGEARVTSALPVSGRAAEHQRRRWEGGHLATLVRHVPRMLKAGLLRRDLRCIALGLDLAVPPLALLVASLALGCAVAGVASIAGAGSAAFHAALFEMSLVGVAVLGAWTTEGRRTLPVRDAVAVPLYVLWKLAMYVRLVRDGGQKAWVRTQRGA